MGSLYVLVALGLTLIYGVLVQINFAHADIVTLGAFAAYFVTHLLSGNYFAGIAVALIVGGALGWLLNAAMFAPLRDRGNELLPLIATIGVSIMLQNAMLVTAWADALRIRHALQQSRDPLRRHLFHGAERADHRGVRPSPSRCFTPS